MSLFTDIKTKRSLAHFQDPRDLSATWTLTSPEIFTDFPLMPGAVYPGMLFIDITPLPRAGLNDEVDPCMAPFIDCWVERREGSAVWGARVTSGRAHRGHWRVWGGSGVADLLGIELAFRQRGENNYSMAGRMTVPVDEHGNLFAASCSLPIWDDDFGSDTAGPWIRTTTGEPAKFAYFANLKCRLSPSERTSVASDCLRHVLRTFALLNCRNVAVAPVGPSAEAVLGRARRQPSERRGLIWHRLVITLGLKRASTKIVPANAGEPMTRAHLCRGHFKDYREDAKLFGKYSGRFWWSPQVRGSKKLGVVLKDYEVRSAPEGHGNFQEPDFPC